jgi:hypothetical protein
MPDLIVCRAATHASHQSALSNRLSPPAKWSYLKVGSWSVLAFLRRLVSLLRQQRDDEFLNGVVYSADVFRVDIRYQVRSPLVPRLEAQSLHVSEAICGVGPLFHLLALRRC